VRGWATLKTTIEADHKTERRPTGYPRDAYQRAALGSQDLKHDLPMNYPLPESTGIYQRIRVLTADKLRQLDVLCLCVMALAFQLMTLDLTAQQPASLTNGLVAYYPFNGNANDESGNGNDGVSFNISFAIDQKWIR